MEDALLRRLQGTLPQDNEGYFNSDSGGTGSLKDTQDWYDWMSGLLNSLYLDATCGEWSSTCTCKHSAAIQVARNCVRAVCLCEQNLRFQGVYACRYRRIHVGMWVRHKAAIAHTPVHTYAPHSMRAHVHTHTHTHTHTHALLHRHAIAWQSCTNTCICLRGNARNYNSFTSAVNYTEISQSSGVCLCFLPQGWKPYQNVM